MRRALIGYTGFVGGNIKDQTSFDCLYNSKNIADIAGQKFDLVVCAGVSSLKWKANENPAADWSAIQRLIDFLKTIETRSFILISTIDVYPNPIGVDEDTNINDTYAQSYGRHRWEFEKFVRGHFPAFTVRLPHLYCKGLKKNVVFDFLHQNRLDLIHEDATWQFYNLKHLWPDIQRAISGGLSLVNFAVEPITTTELARDVFDVEFHNRPSAPALHFDFWTKHAALWKKTGSYLYSKSECLRELRQFRQEATHEIGYF